MSIGDIAMLVNNNFNKTINEQFQDMVALAEDNSTKYSEQYLGKDARSDWAKLPTSQDTPSYLEISSPKKMNIDARGRILIDVPIQIETIARVTSSEGSVTAGFTCELYKNGNLIATDTNNLSEKSDRIERISELRFFSMLPLEIERGDFLEFKLKARRISGLGNGTVYFAVKNIDFNVEIYAVPKLIGMNYFYTE